MTEQLNCALLQDYVFPFLGHSTESARKFIGLDYTKSLADILTKTCAHLISSLENLVAVLHYVAHIATQSRPLGSTINQNQEKLSGIPSVHRTIPKSRGISCQRLNLR